MPQINAPGYASIPPAAPQYGAPPQQYGAPAPSPFEPPRQY
jgi:hypothetical protein